MASKLFNKAHRSKTLRDSGLFSSYPSLKNALLIAVSNKVYILYARESSTYFFINLSQEYRYEILTMLQSEKMIELAELIIIADKLTMEESN
jgi:hypothetical protein